MSTAAATTLGDFGKLPRELRDYIYKEVFGDSVKVTLDVCLAGPHRGAIYSPPATTATELSSHASVSRVSKQFRDETLPLFFEVAEFKFRYGIFEDCEGTKLHSSDLLKFIRNLTITNEKNRRQKSKKGEAMSLNVYKGLLTRSGAPETDLPLTVELHVSGKGTAANWEVTAGPRMSQQEVHVTRATTKLVEELEGVVAEEQKGAGLQLEGLLEMVDAFVRTLYNFLTWD
ncbi:hypothetical protein LTR85_009025 [Meristemomyces frigidus]|nr:hypothetical protein LTR85_009025 [Meristemomyces frigidus]